MNISAALTLLSMVAYAAGAVKSIQKAAQLTNTVSAALPGAVLPTDAFPELLGSTLVNGGTGTVATAVSSASNPVGTTVNHGSTTHQSIGAHIYPGIPYDAYYNPYFPAGYPGYGTGLYPGFHSGPYKSYLRWAYPGLSAGFYPGFLHSTRHGFSSPLYPGLLEASQHGLFGGAYSRYLSGVYPGLFGGEYGSLYGSRFFGNGALEKVRTHLAGYQTEVTLTVDPLTGLPVPVTVPVANRVVTIERLVPFPSPFPVSVPSPYPVPFPLPHPGVNKPVSSTTHIGSTTTVSQGAAVVPAVDGAPVVSGQQEAVAQTQSHVNIS
uniref:HL35 antigen U n=1 Tax=Haemaphysalis longicornis TaxID=44386 RepID=Q9GRB9_HAELO|nr:HL35 antigen U [Haemaphysalis longicornis]